MSMERGMLNKLCFWKEANSRMWTYLEGGYEIYSNLNKMNEIFSEMDASDLIFEVRKKYTV